MGIYFNTAAAGTIEGNTFDAIGHAAIGIDSDGEVIISGNNISNASIDVTVGTETVNITIDGVAYPGE